MLADVVASLCLEGVCRIHLKLFWVPPTMSSDACDEPSISFGQTVSAFPSGVNNHSVR